MPESDRPQHTVGHGTVTVVFIVVMIILAISQAVVGAVYRNDCPRQPFIPVYLCGIVAVSFLIVCCTCCKMCNMCNMTYLTTVVSLCWLFAGIVTIYSIYEPNYNKNTTQHIYCNKTLYLFAFWSTILTYVLLGVILFCCCCSRLQEQGGEAQPLLQNTDYSSMPSMHSSIDWFDIDFDTDFM